PREAQTVENSNQSKSEYRMSEPTIYRGRFFAAYAHNLYPSNKHRTHKQNTNISLFTGVPLQPHDPNQLFHTQTTSPKVCRSNFGTPCICQSYLTASLQCDCDNWENINMNNYSELQHITPIRNGAKSFEHCILGIFFSFIINST
ncbi:hypothetical protein L9F63_013910, partial [Diploptera punctata]